MHVFYVSILLGKGQQHFEETMVCRKQNDRAKNQLASGMKRRDDMIRKEKEREKNTGLTRAF